MKKIFLTFFSIVSLLFTSPALVFAAGSTLSIAPATGTFNKGCDFSLTVSLDTGGYETAGTDLILIYDTSRFIANKISNGSVYPDYPGNIIDTQAGSVSISGIASGTSSYKGAGTLATVDFSVLETAPPGASQIKIDFDGADKSKTTDSNVVEVGTMAETLNQVVNGNYVIGTGACGQGGGNATGSATITRTPTSYIPPTPLPGTADFNSTLILVILGFTLTSLGVFSLARR